LCFFLILCYGLFISVASPCFAGLNTISDRRTPFGYGLLVIGDDDDDDNDDNNVSEEGKEAYYPA
jgi:hypothetical protein